MIASVLGGIIKTILSPVVRMIFSGLYSILIKGPLQLLNVEDRILGYAVGGYTDKLLFNTSLVDGKPQLNFFSSDSPLKPFYMSMLAAGGLLLTIFLGFAIMSTFTKSKGKPGVLKKMGHLTLSASAIVVVPTAFITAVSLSGAIISTLGGRNKSASKNDISEYRGFLNNKLNTLGSAQYNTAAFNKTIKSDFNNGLLYWDKDVISATPWVDNVTKTNVTKNINELYEYLSEDGDKALFKPSEDIRTIASQSRDYYKVMNDSLFRYSQSIPTLKLGIDNEQGINYLNRSKAIIGKLTPQYKNENDADIIRDMIVELSSLQDKIINWKKSVDDMLSYLPENIGSGQDTALHNFESAFNVIWGDTKNSTNKIQNISSLNRTIADVVNGSAKTGLGGMYNLKQQITNFNDSSLVVTFYQVVTGNKDKNWNQAFPGLKNGGMMLLIGFFMICGAILMLAGIIIEAFIRIILLGLLFIFGGLLIPISPLDDGARIKTWINVVVGQLISIFGVILILRFGFVIMDRFGDLLDAGNDFSGSQGYLTRSIAMAFFAYAVMQGANKSRQLLLQIAGSNQGLMSNPGSWAGQFKSGFSRIWNSGRSFGKGSGRALGLSSKASGKAAYAGQNSQSGPSGSSRGSNFKSTWANRGRKAISTIKAPVRKVDKVMAGVSGGKYGSQEAKATHLENKASKIESRNFKAKSQAAKKKWMPTRLKNAKNRVNEVKKDKAAFKKGGK